MLLNTSAFTAPAGRQAPGSREILLTARTVLMCLNGQPLERLL